LAQEAAFIERQKGGFAYCHDTGKCSATLITDGLGSKTARTRPHGSRGGGEHEPIGGSLVKPLDIPPDSRFVIFC
jgi:hypothetical protein